MGMYRSRKNPKRVFKVKHNELLILKILKTTHKHLPKLFIELGTHYGGLPLALHEEFGTELRVVSFDRNFNGRQILDLVRPKNAVVLYGRKDILKKTNKILVDLLCEDDKKILYCDNGNKPQEVNIYAKYLKPGDLLGVHDFLSVLPNVLRVDKDSDKPNTEIVDYDMIRETINKYNFVPYDLETHWLCDKRKIVIDINGDPHKMNIGENCSRFWIKRK